MSLDAVKALTFDVGGTVYDWQSATQAAVATLARSRSAELDVREFCLRWRRDMFRRLAKVRSGEIAWANADELHRAVLDPLTDDYPQLELSDDDKAALTTVWHRMEAWPDFGPALPRLRKRFTVCVLTVLSWSIAVDCAKRNGLWWDGILSCEMLGAYKPDPEAYQRGAELLDLEPHEIMMVASHPGDLRAAMAVGFRTAFVLPRHEEPGGNDDKNPDDFDILADDFTDLANKITS